MNNHFCILQTSISSMHCRKYFANYISIPWGTDIILIPFQTMCTLYFTIILRALLFLQHDSQGLEGRSERITDTRIHDCTMPQWISSPFNGTGSWCKLSNFQCGMCFSPRLRAGFHRRFPLHRYLHSLFLPRVREEELAYRLCGVVDCARLLPG